MDKNMLTDSDNLVQIVTTCVTGKGGNVNRAIGGMVPKDLLNKLYAVYDEIENFQEVDRTGRPTFID